MCLPWESECALNDLAAAVSTSNATWTMIPIALLAATATFIAIVVALRAQTRQFARDSRLVDQQDNNAAEAFRTANELCKSISASIPNHDPIKIEEVWRHIGNIASHRRTLEHYLSGRLSTYYLVFQVNQSIQRLYEADSALKLLTEQRNWESSGSVGQAHRSMERVVGRIDKSGEGPRALFM